MGNKYPSLHIEALKNITTIAGKTNLDFLQKILNTYLTGTPESLKKIQAGFEHKSPQEISSVAHALKSNSALVGALHLQSLLIQLEKVSKGAESFDETQSKELIEKIQTEYKNVEQDLKNYLNDIRSIV